MKEANEERATYIPMLVSFDVLRTKICQGVGRDTVARLSDEAGATIKIGKKRFCNVSKFQKYLDSISDEQEEQARTPEESR